MFVFSSCSYLSHTVHIVILNTDVTCTYLGERWLLRTAVPYPSAEALVDVATVNSFQFRVKACSNARLDLASGPQMPNNAAYSFILGLSCILV